jgi:hypothetical protein
MRCNVSWGDSSDKERSRRESRIVLRVVLSAPWARARTCSAILSIVKSLLLWQRRKRIDEWNVDEWERLKKA